MTVENYYSANQAATLEMTVSEQCIVFSDGANMMSCERPAHVQERIESSSNHAASNRTAANSQKQVKKKKDVRMNNKSGNVGSQEMKKTKLSG